MGEGRTDPSATCDCEEQNFLGEAKAKRCAWVLAAPVADGRSRRTSRKCRAAGPAALSKSDLSGCRMDR